MFKNLGRTLANIARNILSVAQPQLNHNKQTITASDRQAVGRAQGRKGKASGAAALKRASKKANNIRKHN